MQSKMGDRLGLPASTWTGFDDSARNVGVVLGASTFFLYLCYQLACQRFTKSPFPPGPSSLPIIGNIFHYPSDFPWLKFTEWKHQFGPIVRLHGLGNEIIILNTIESVNDLLIKQGNLYSDRPATTFGSELIGLDRATTMMSNTDVWRLHRKLTHTAFSQESVKKYVTTQEDIAILLNIGLIESPEHFVDHVRLATGRILMSVTYGISPKVAEEDYITETEDALLVLTQVATPGASIVDFIPALKYLPECTPFFTFHAQAKRAKAMLEKLVSKPYYQIKAELASEKPPPPSFVSDLLNWPDDGCEDRQTLEDAVMWAAGSMYGAGSDTTYSTVLNTILAMALYPEIQRKAQEELDSVIGNRLPTVADRDSTPYLNALIREVLRWYPSAPMSLPHRSRKDIVYKGYLIPKNAIVIPNVWAIAHEPDPDFPPEDFFPERFLKRDNGIEIEDPNQYVFGFGRRICPGRFLAGNSVYIMIAYIIHCFSIGPPRDASGNETAIDPTWKASITSFPNPFKCEIKPRSEEKVAICRHRETSILHL